MRTPPDTPPPNYLGRKFQLRMMSMVGLLVLVLVAIDRAREPSSWYWLTGPPRPAPSSPNAADTPGPTSEPVTPELLDAVTVPGEDLAEITDDSVGLRGEESGPYHRILARARDLPQAHLEAVAGDVAFSVLQKQPEHFRGQVVTVSGDLRRLMSFPVRENDEGITELYEALVFTADSGTTPYRIRLTTPPTGLPTGESIDPPTPVRVVGYFFKRDQYIVQQDLRVHAAPLLLAQRIDRRATGAAGATSLPPTAADRLRWAVTLLGLVVAGIAVTLLWTWRARRGDLRFAAEGLKRSTAAPDGAIEALEGIETVDPDEFFRQMGESEDVNQQ